MLGRSHVMFGLTAAVVLDGVMHISGSPLATTTPVPVDLIINKVIFFSMVALGALLPDIDNAQSTIGRRFGWISKEIQHIAGHRTIFHSLLGLLSGSLFALGLQQLLIFFLAQRGFIFPAQFIEKSHLVFVAILIGCILHIAADGLTEGGVPLLWPNHKRFGFPPNPHWRFRTGDWPEYVIVYSCMLVVFLGVWQAIIKI
ncbi:MAG: metal-dependent hydrolase [Ktedonobacteraceae bacterium]